MLKRNPPRGKSDTTLIPPREPSTKDTIPEVAEDPRQTVHLSQTVGLSSGIRDNYIRGTVASFLREKIQVGSVLSAVSAYFTIYAYEALKDQLTTIDQLRFLFGEPRFIKSLDPEKIDKKSFKIEDDGLQLINDWSKNVLLRHARNGSKKKYKSDPSSSQICFTGKCITLLIMVLRTLFSAVQTSPFAD